MILPKFSCGKCSNSVDAEITTFTQNSVQSSELYYYQYIIMQIRWITSCKKCQTAYQLKQVKTCTVYRMMLQSSM